ncbi:MAG: hypothetical protein HN995_01820 [Candidatus Marinimicrobia bacterium]|nr:hypothetical protein [Candidatus Neomarinimicrobiota bacterium]
MFSGYLEKSNRRFVFLFLVILQVFIAACNEPEPTEITMVGPYSTPIIYQDTTIVWSAENGTVYLDRSIVIDASSRLVINPGVRVHFLDSTMIYNADWSIEYIGPSELRVEGGFICEGAPDNQIHFTGGEGRSQIIDIQHDQLMSQPLLVKWSQGLEGLHIYGGSPSINHSNINFVMLEDCNSVYVGHSVIDAIYSIQSSGVILKNIMKESLLSIGGMFQIDSNVIGNDSVRGLYGFRSHNNDVSIFMNNVIKNHDIPVYIFSGSPTIKRNNIEDYAYPVVVLPHMGNPDSDTLDFSYNWWGQRTSSEIINGIDFRSNGGALSKKIIEITPIATVPFDLEN